MAYVSMFCLNGTSEKKENEKRAAIDRLVRLVFCMSLTIFALSHADSDSLRIHEVDAPKDVLIPDSMTSVDSLEKAVADSTTAKNTLFGENQICTDSVGDDSKRIQGNSERKNENPYGIPDALMPLWESMSLKQKAAQMVMVYMSPESFMLKHEFGGTLVMKSHLKDPVKFRESINSINSSLKIPLFVAIDQEGGRVNRVSSISYKFKNTPSAREMREMPVEEIEKTAKEIADSMHAYGINMNLAPVLDPSIDSRGKKSFMEESARSWGVDTSNADKIRAFVRGMKNSGIICVSKHFPGYDSWTNSDHQIAVSATPKKKIKENIRLFKALSDEIPATMMSSVRFVRVSNRPAVFEKQIVKRARNLSPDMLIITDDLWGASLRAFVSGTERIKGKNYPARDFRKLIRIALESGNDMFMTTYPAKAVEMIKYLERLGKSNESYRKRIEESAARILKLKFKTHIIR